MYVIEKCVKYNINEIDIEDKIITMKGYCLVLMDEGCGFLKVSSAKMSNMKETYLC